jgi:hypothetical protein
LGWEPFFSGPVALSITVDNFAKCYYMQTARDTHDQWSYAD